MQLAVRLRKITLKNSPSPPLRLLLYPLRLCAARSCSRVHVWQLHVDILPAAYSEPLSSALKEEKVKAAAVTLGSERCKSLLGHEEGFACRQPEPTAYNVVFLFLSSFFPL